MNTSLSLICVYNIECMHTLCIDESRQQAHTNQFLFDFENKRKF